MDCFLILGSNQDPHVAAVAARLRDMGVKVCTLDHESSNSFRIEILKNGSHEIILDDQAIDPYLIWCRVKLRPIRFVSDEISSYLALSTEEWLGFYKDLIFIHHNKVLNDIVGASFCSFKANQLIAANDVGFNIPSTIITNSIDCATMFLSKTNSAVVKRIAGGTYVRYNKDSTNHNHMYVDTILINRINLSDLCAEDPEHFSICPSLIQEEVKKKYEIRVVYISGEIFAFAINSQECEEAKIDWRRAGSKLSYEFIKLPDLVIQKIHNFMQRYNLFSGSFDFIEDYEGGIWFLECNPDGQWFWLDELVEGKISDCFAEKFRDKMCRVSAAEGRNV